MTNWKMIRRVSCAVMLAVVFLSAGCRTKTEPVLPPEPERVRNRAKDIAALWGRDNVRSVLFREQDLTHYRAESGLPQLLRRLTGMKVNHAYLAVETADTLGSRSGREALAAMITAFHEAGISCDMVLPQHLFLAKRSATVLHRAFGGKDTPFEDLFHEALRLKRHLPDEVPAPGITVWAGIHRLTAVNEALPPGMLYRWSEENYGIGSDNDILMKQFLADLARYQKMAKVDNIRFSVAVPALYHAKASAGMLSAGRVTDFLQTADTVLVMGYGNKPSEYLKSLQEMLGSDSSGRVRCGMVLSGHVSESVGALRRRSWQDFFRILSVMHRSCGNMPGYGGMVLIPWQNVELLQER